MNDFTCRTRLKQNLVNEHRGQPDTVIVDELPLRQGETRVDVAIVNGILHGYEIKSERDTLSRLPQQVWSYGLVLDKATLVVAERHLTAALEILPAWWGVEVVTGTNLNTLQFRSLRASQLNHHVDALHVAELLWREEALQFLEARGAARGYRSKSRDVLHRRMVDIADLEEIRTCVRFHLKHRTEWKAVSLSATSGD